MKNHNRNPGLVIALLVLTVLSTPVARRVTAQTREVAEDVWAVMLTSWMGTGTFVQGSRINGQPALYFGGSIESWSGLLCFPDSSPGAVSADCVSPQDLRLAIRRANGKER